MDNGNISDEDKFRALVHHIADIFEHIRRHLPAHDIRIPNLGEMIANLRLRADDLFAEEETQPSTLTSEVQAESEPEPAIDADPDKYQQHIEAMRAEQSAMLPRSGPPTPKNVPAPPLQPMVAPPPEVRVAPPKHSSIAKPIQISGDGTVKVT
jgi:hypothetical protein